MQELTELTALKPACSSAMIFSTCGVNLFSMIFSMTAWMADEADWQFCHCCWLPFWRSVMTKDLGHRVGHSPVCQILVQIVTSAVINASPPAWTSSAKMLTSLLHDCTAASLHFFAEDGMIVLCVSLRSTVLMDLHWSCDYSAQSSILSISLVSLVLL